MSDINLYVKKKKTSMLVYKEVTKNYYLIFNGI